MVVEMDKKILIYAAIMAVGITGVMIAYIKDHRKYRGKKKRISDQIKRTDRNKSKHVFPASEKNA